MNSVYHMLHAPKPTNHHTLTVIKKMLIYQQAILQRESWKMKKAKAITFRSLSKNVQKALRLLRKQPKKAFLGVGHGSYYDCPIARAYRVQAVSPWSFIFDEDKLILRKFGWTGIIYNRFINWYDCIDENKNMFLKNYFLESIHRSKSK